MLGLFWGKQAGRGSERAGRADRRRGPAVRRDRRPALEGLEVRIAPATDVWTGGAGDGLWMTAGNWSAGTIPAANDDLDFPSGAASLSNTNNFTGITFNSIAIGGAGYTLSGNALTLTSGITANYTGTSTDAIPTALTAATTPISVASGSDLVVSATGVLSGSVGLNVTGGGTLDLEAVNTYTGSTTVASGTTLLVNGTIADVQDNGGVLTGNGSVGAVTSVGGTISPGPSAPGVLTATGSVALDSGSTFATELDGTSPGNGATGYGQLVVSGSGNTVSLGGATLNATLGPDYSTPTPGDQLTIISNGGGSAVTGTFAELPEGAAVSVGSALFRISYAGGASGQDVVLTAVQATGTTTTTLATIASPSTYGQAVTLSATVAGTQAGSPIPTGTVEFFDGNPTTGGTEVASAALNGGAATTTDSTLNVANSPHQIFAVYVPTSTDFTFAGSTSAPQSVTINPATLTVTGVAAGNKLYDSTTTATVSASGATLHGVLNGDVVTLNTATVAGTFTSPNAGNNIPVTVTGLALSGTGSSNYVLAQPTGVTADIIPAPLTLTANNQTMIAGAAVPTLTFTATGFLGTDSVADLTTQPTLTTTATSSSPPGVYPIDISGGTAANYTITDVPGQLSIITSSATTTTLSTSSQLSVIGQPVTFTAIVAPASTFAGKPTGTVAFYADNSLLGSSTLDSAGQASFTTSSLGYSAHSIIAVYTGDTTFQASESSALTQYVTSAGTQPVMTILPVRNRHGKVVRFELVTEVQPTAPGGGTPTGSVIYYINGRASSQVVPLTGGTAVLARIPPRLINKFVFVRYIGSQSYVASASPNMYISYRLLAELSKTQAR